MVGTTSQCGLGRLGVVLQQYPRTVLPIRHKVADIAHELLRVLTVVEVAGVIDDEHPRALILLWQRRFFDPPVDWP